MKKIKVVSISIIMILTLCKKIEDVSSTGTGNHKTTYSIDMPDTIFKDERLMIKIRKESGEEVNMCYNGNDFDSKLIIE